VLCCLGSGILDVSSLFVCVLLRLAHSLFILDFFSFSFCVRVCVVLTDNRLMSNTTSSRELQLAVSHFPSIINSTVLKKIVMQGFHAAFFPGPPVNKHNYIRKVEHYYNQMYEAHKHKVR
jgi:hypothetical protein